MSSDDGERGDEEIPGRGMLGVSMDEDGMIQMEHQFTDKTFEFDRKDLDEVIGVLATFRMSIEARESAGNHEGNGLAT